MDYKAEAHKSRDAKHKMMTASHEKHADEKEDAMLVRGMVKTTALKHRAHGGAVADGMPAKARMDRAKKGGHKAKAGGSHVNILVNPKIGGAMGAPDDGSDGSGAPSPAMMGGAGAPPMGPAMPPPGAGAPMQPPMKRGGRVHRATGGKVTEEAGAGSGLGRLEKIKEYGKNARH